jgi:hypothetical protein
MPDERFTLFGRPLYEDYWAVMYEDEQGQSRLAFCYASKDEARARKWELVAAGKRAWISHEPPLWSLETLVGWAVIPGFLLLLLVNPWIAGAFLVVATAVLAYKKGYRKGEDKANDKQPY